MLSDGRMHDLYAKAAAVIETLSRDDVSQVESLTVLAMATVLAVKVAPDPVERKRLGAIYLAQIEAYLAKMT